MVMFSRVRLGPCLFSLVGSNLSRVQVRLRSSKVETNQVRFEEVELGPYYTETLSRDHVKLSWINRTSGQTRSTRTKVESNKSGN